MRTSKRNGTQRGSSKGYPTVRHPYEAEGVRYSGARVDISGGNDSDTRIFKYQTDGIIPHREEKGVPIDIILVER